MEMGARAIFEIDAEYYVLQEDYDELEEENKKLKEELDRMTERACDYKGEITELKMENEKLKKWIKEHVDYQTQADFRKKFNVK